MMEPQRIITRILTMVALNAQRDELREEKSGAARDSEHNLRLIYTEVQYYKLKQE